MSDMNGQTPESQWASGGYQQGNPQQGYGYPGQPYPAAEVMGNGQQPETVPQPRRERRKVGLGTALALMLVGSIVSGSVVGVTVSSMKGGSTTVTNSLEQPSAKTVNHEDQAGAVENVAKTVLPAVVSIRTPQLEGSGSIISSDGLVLTNHHVAAPGARTGLQVTLNDGSVHRADYVASDAATDIAVIKIRDVSDLPTLQFGDSSSLVVGQQVVAVGAPLGLSSTVTSGIVSALNRPVRASQEGGESSLIDAVQTDAAINPGNSGGPLVDMEGHLVGMNSVIASLSQGSGEEAGSIGLGFAIPSNFAKRVADQLVDSGKAVQPMLGASVLFNHQGSGAYIRDVVSGGAADKAGLKSGDVVTKLGDRRIDSADALIAAVRSHNFGDTVTLTVTDSQGNNERTVEATLSSE